MRLQSAGSAKPSVVDLKRNFRYPRVMEQAERWSADDLNAVFGLIKKLKQDEVDITSEGDLIRAERLRKLIRELEGNLKSYFEQTANPSEAPSGRKAAVSSMQEFMNRKLQFGEPTTREKLHEGHHR